MEKQANKAVHITWEGAHRAEAERDNARRTNCKPIPPSRIKLITIHLSRDLSKLRTSALRLWSGIFDHRIRTASSKREYFFTSETVRRITAYSKELRGFVNTIGEKALLAAHSVSRSAVSAKMVKDEKLSQDFRPGVETSVETDVRAVNYQTLKNQGKVGAEEARRAQSRDLDVGLKDIPPKIDSERRLIKAAIAIGLAIIFLAGLGTLSYAPRSKNSLFHLARKWGAIAQPERRDIADVKVPVEGPKGQRAAPQLASINSVPIQPEGRGSTAERAPGSLGNFEVVDNSFVRENPEANAAIIATLRPGTEVRVESKTGDYLRIRSLSNGRVVGYVHREDAFFQSH